MTEEWLTDDMYTEGMMVDESIIAIILIFGLVALLIGLISYIVTAYSYMVMANNSGIENSWLAWIPLANIWIIGELVSERLNNKGGLIYLLVTIANIVISSFIPIIGILSGIAFLVFTIYISYLVFKKFSNNPILHTILSFIIPLYFVIVLFVIRNNRPAEI